MVKPGWIGVKPHSRANSGELPEIPGADIFREGRTQGSLKPPGPIRRLPMSLRRILFAIAAVLCLVASPPEARAESADYRDAEAQFLRLPRQARYELQMLLAAAGYWDAVGTDRYSRKLFDAVRYAQGLFGFRPNGLLSKELIERIHEKADPVLLGWDLKEVRHPTIGTPLWVPAGLPLDVEKTKVGLNLKSKDSSILIVFDFFKSISLREGFSTVLEISKKDRHNVLHKSINDDDFVVVAADD